MNEKIKQLLKTRDGENVMLAIELLDEKHTYGEWIKILNPLGVYLTSQGILHALDEDLGEMPQKYKHEW